jgi:hypothetical protein
MACSCSAQPYSFPPSAPLAAKFDSWDDVRATCNLQSNAEAMFLVSSQLTTGKDVRRSQPVSDVLAAEKSSNVRTFRYF